MAEYKILVPGYAKEEDGKVIASSTSVFVTEGQKNFIVDPGINPDKLREALENFEIKISDIDFIYLTHYHPDHIFNIRLFPDLPVYDGGTIYINDEETFFEGMIPDTNIEIIPTPGHSGEHTSLLFTTPSGRKIAIAGDVFWWMDDEDQEDNLQDLLDHEDPFASDFEALRESRQKLLELSDIIIPGHGPEFEVGD